MAPVSMLSLGPARIGFFTAAASSLSRAWPARTCLFYASVSSVILTLAAAPAAGLRRSGFWLCFEDAESSSSCTYSSPAFTKVSFCVLLFSNAGLWHFVASASFLFVDSSCAGASFTAGGTESGPG